MREPASRLAASFAAVTVTLSMLVAAPNSGAQDWQEVSPDKARIVVHVPGLEQTPPTFARLKPSSGRTIERAYVLPAIGQFPQALVILDELQWRSGKVFTSKSFAPLPETVLDTFSDSDVSVQEASRLANHMGELDAQRFSLHGNTHCIYVRQFPAIDAGIGIADGVGISLGHMVVYAWYCADSGVTLDDPAILAFVNGIGVRGFRVPDGSIVKQPDGKTTVTTSTIPNTNTPSRDKSLLPCTTRIQSCEGHSY